MAITHTFVSALPDNAADAAAGLAVTSDWNADHAVTSIQIATGTITASEPAVDITQTWNNAAVTFTASKVNVTDTASASGSLLADWRVGGASKAYLDKSGALTFVGSDATKVQIGNAAVLFLYQTGLSGHASGDMMIRNQAWTKKAVLSVDVGNNTLSLRDSTNAQTFYVFGTYTDSSNYVRASLASSSTAVTLAAQTAGTGADNVPVNLTPAGTEGVVIGNFAQFAEMTAPAAGAANTARLFCEDNGSGKTRLMVQFASGAAQQIAIEP